MNMLYIPFKILAIFNEYLYNEVVKFNGELSEWSNEHDWKSCIRHKRIGGSNPPLSASRNPI